MTEPTSKASEKQIKNHPMAPIYLYKRIFCQHCQDQEYCHTNLEHMKLCIFCLIADEPTRQRQLTQQRTQHQSW